MVVSGVSGVSGPCWKRGGAAAEQARRRVAGRWGRLAIGTGCLAATTGGATPVSGQGSRCCSRTRWECVGSRSGDAGADVESVENAASGIVGMLVTDPQDAARRPGSRTPVGCAAAASTVIDPWSTAGWAARDPLRLTRLGWAGEASRGALCWFDRLGRTGKQRKDPPLSWGRMGIGGRCFPTRLAARDAGKSLVLRCVAALCG
jgi:hypothetical protein